MTSLTTHLSFSQLQIANEERQAVWCPDPNVQPDLAFRGVELAGEVGEACNVIKKLERERQGWRGSRSSIDALKEELADVIIVASLIANWEGIDLADAVVEKFNKTSREVGLPVFL